MHHKILIFWFLGRFHMFLICEVYIDLKKCRKRGYFNKNALLRYLCELPSGNKVAVRRSFRWNILKMSRCGIWVNRKAPMYISLNYVAWIVLRLVDVTRGSWSLTFEDEIVMLFLEHTTTVFGIWFELIPLVRPSAHTFLVWYMKMVAQLWNASEDGI